MAMTYDLWFGLWHDSLKAKFGNFKNWCYYCNAYADNEIMRIVNSAGRLY